MGYELSQKMGPLSVFSTKDDPSTLERMGAVRRETAHTGSATDFTFCYMHWYQSRGV